MYAKVTVIQRDIGQLQDPSEGFMYDAMVDTPTFC
jgi:hypothetical protein